MFCKTIGVALATREAPKAPPPLTAGPAAGAAAPRLDRWFGLELPESDPSLTAAYRSGKPCELVIDVLVRADALPPGAVLMRRGRRAGRGPLLLERWRLALDRRRTAPHMRLALVYKRAVVHFRTLYALAHALPAAGLVRQIRSAAGSLGALQIVADVRASAPPAPELLTWELARIDTPLGAVLGTVEYADADLGVATEAPALDGDLALLAHSPRSLTNHPLSSSPVPPIPLPAHTHLLEVMLEVGEGGLQSIYREAAKVRGTKNGNALTPAHAHARYVQEPSYRREAATDDLCSSPGRPGPRSWSQRLEARRQMEQYMARDSPGVPAAPGSMPSGSRLFRRTPVAPALALVRPERAHVTDELTALVRMIDARALEREPR